MLFLWKVFELACLLLLLAAYAFTHLLAHAPLPDLTIEVPLLVPLASYVLYILLMLRHVRSIDSDERLQMVPGDSRSPI